jgi:hypothetical protein
VHGRALAVMYDLSGLKAKGKDCSCIMADIAQEAATPEFVVGELPCASI